MSSWLWSSSKTPAIPSTGVPDRSQRQQCWDSRDAYFGCLDKKNVPVPGMEEGACGKEDGEYKKSCAASWVDYFNKRRVLQLRQDLMEAKAAQQREAAGGPITGERRA